MLAHVAAWHDSAADGLLRYAKTGTAAGMDISTELSTTASRDGPMRWRSVGYWLATVLVAAELGLGGIWTSRAFPTSATS